MISGGRVSTESIDRIRAGGSRALGDVMGRARGGAGTGGVEEEDGELWAVAGREIRRCVMGHGFTGCCAGRSS